MKNHRVLQKVWRNLSRLFKPLFWGLFSIALVFVATLAGCTSSDAPDTAINTPTEISSISQGSSTSTSTALPPSTSDSASPSTTQPLDETLESKPVELGYEIINQIAHNSSSFTQGLIFVDGAFYESTGAPSGSASQLLVYELESPLNPTIQREVEPADFAEWFSGEIPQSVFAEGLEKVGDLFYQLSWKAETVFVWESSVNPLPPLRQLTPKGILTYSGEGWGICYDGTYIYMSNGTAVLSIRDPVSFAEIDTLTITRDGASLNGPDARINELECAQGYIWANVWFSDEILRIDPKTGIITGVLQANKLEMPRPEDRNGVLNGIAYSEDTETYWLTGKYWNSLYEIRILN